MALQNDLILRAARGEKTERVPVWMMRQAGRILKEYREVREAAGNFKNLVENPEMASEVTIQPVDLLGVDAAIIFSDILVVPEAMGLEYQMIEKKGPWFEKTIQSDADLKNIRIPDVNEELGYVFDAISLTVKNLQGRVPLIGFCGAPWTIFSYMVEGSGSKTFSKAKKILYTNPALAERVMDMIADTSIAYLKGQIAAGANMLQLFDSWAGILSPEQYRRFALKYIKKICDAIDEVPVTVFAKGAYFVREDLGKLACNTIGLDWNMDRKESRQLIGNEKTLQGNLDPCMLYAEDEMIVSETQKMIDEFGTQKYIANLGHGVYPDTSPDKVRVFIDTVKEYSKQKVLV